MGILLSRLNSKHNVFANSSETVCNPFKLESHSFSFRSCHKKLVRCSGINQTQLVPRKATSAYTSLRQCFSET